MDEGRALEWLLTHKEELPVLLDEYFRETRLNNVEFAARIGTSEGAIRFYRSGERFPKGIAVQRNLIREIQPVIERRILRTPSTTSTKSTDKETPFQRTHRIAAQIGRPLSDEECTLLSSIGIHFHTYGSEPLTPQFIDALLLLARGEKTRKELEPKHGTTPPDHRTAGLSYSPGDRSDE